MNLELISKYERALDMANSNAKLGRYIQLIRETLYKLLQPGYMATIDEIVWAECFINREQSLDDERSEQLMVLKEFTQVDWSGYSGAARFPDGSNPMIASKELNDAEFVVIIAGNGIQLEIIQLDETHYCFVENSLHKKLKILIANYICGIADTCSSVIDLVSQLEQLDMKFEDLEKWRCRHEQA